MTAYDILKILDSLANYVVYLYPGYITIYIFYFLKGITLEDTKGIAIKSIVLSFLYKLCVDKLQFNSDIGYHIAMIAIAIIVPYVGYCAQKNKLVKKIFVILGIHTMFEDNEIDYLNTGTVAPWVRVYLKNTDFVYEGFLTEYELEGNKRQCVILKKYRKYLLDETGKPQKPFIHNFCTDDDAVVIYYDDIKIIEKYNLKNES